MGLKVLSGRDGKNIDRTGKQKIKLEKIGKGATFFSPNISYEGGQKIGIFYLRGQNFFN